MNWDPPRGAWDGLGQTGMGFRVTGINWDEIWGCWEGTGSGFGVTGRELVHTGLYWDELGGHWEVTGPHWDELGAHWSELVSHWFLSLPSPSPSLSLRLALAGAWWALRGRGQAGRGPSGRGPDGRGWGRILALLEAVGGGAPGLLRPRHRARLNLGLRAQVGHAHLCRPRLLPHNPRPLPARPRPPLKSLPIVGIGGLSHAHSSKPRPSWVLNE